MGKNVDNINEKEENDSFIDFLTDFFDELDETPEEVRERQNISFSDFIDFLTDVFKESDATLKTKITGIFLLSFVFCFFYFLCKKKE